MDHESLRTCALFAGIEGADIPVILGCLDARKKNYPKDDFILKAGTKVTQVGVVLEGCVNLIQEDYWGNRTLIEQVLPGGVFGEAFACAEVEMIPLSVVAAKESTILFIDYKRIITVCSSACTFHLNLIKNMIGSIAYKNVALTRKIEHTNKRSIRDKILAYLSSQAILNDSPSFTIPFSRQELADYLAVDRASLSRSLGMMKADGIIELQGRRATLLRSRYEGEAS